VSNYTRGRDTEYKAVRTLEAAGYVAFRSAGSHSPVDVVAIGPTGVRLIQLKRAKQGKNWQAEYEVAREQLLALPKLPGVTREIWVWVDRDGWVKQEVV
jgi:Archaeal holliday junction resolvase (hjc).